MKLGKCTLSAAIAFMLLGFASSKAAEALDPADTETTESYEACQICGSAENLTDAQAYRCNNQKIHLTCATKWASLNKHCPVCQQKPISCENFRKFIFSSRFPVTARWWIPEDTADLAEVSCRGIIPFALLGAAAGCAVGCCTPCFIDVPIFDCMGCKCVLESGFDGVCPMQAELVSSCGYAAAGACAGAALGSLAGPPTTCVICSTSCLAKRCVKSCCQNGDSNSDFSGARDHLIDRTNEETMQR